MYILNISLSYFPLSIKEVRAFYLQRKNYVYNKQN
jgi:hypothetical protein